MPKRISKTAHQYAGRDLKAGDLFHVEPQHVELLLAIGRIEPQQGEPGYVAPEAVAPARREAQRKPRKAA